MSEESKKHPSRPFPSMEKEARIQLVMEKINLTREQAIEYLMEREYNQLNHGQALAALTEKPWLWSNYKEEGK